MVKCAINVVTVNSAFSICKRNIKEYTIECTLSVAKIRNIVFLVILPYLYTFLAPEILFFNASTFICTFYCDFWTPYGVCLFEYVDLIRIQGSMVCSPFEESALMQL